MSVSDLKKATQAGEVKSAVNSLPPVPAAAIAEIERLRDQGKKLSQKLAAAIQNVARTRVKPDSADGQYQFEQAHEVEFKLRSEVRKNNQSLKDASALIPRRFDSALPVAQPSNAERKPAMEHCATCGAEVIREGPNALWPHRKLNSTRECPGRIAAIPEPRAATWDPPIRLLQAGSPGLGKRR